MGWFTPFVAFCSGSLVARSLGQCWAAIQSASTLRDQLVLVFPQETKGRTYSNKGRDVTGLELLIAEVLLAVSATGLE